MNLRIISTALGIISVISHILLFWIASIAGGEMSPIGPFLLVLFALMILCALFGFGTSIYGATKEKASSFTLSLLLNLNPILYPVFLHLYEN